MGNKRISSRRPLSACESRRVSNGQVRPKDCYGGSSLPLLLPRRLLIVLQQIFKWKQPPTPRNASILTAYVAAAEGGDFGPPFAPCAVVHPWMDSCSWTAVDRWQAVFRWMFPVYAALHVIPPILLRRKVFFKESVLHFVS